MRFKDFNYDFTALDQRARGTITIDDFEALRGAKASGTIEVDDYTKLIEAAATGSITYGVPVDGDIILVDGNTFTKVAESPGAGEFSNISELEALVEAVTGVNSSQDGTTIAITAATAGAAGNEITLELGAENAGTMAISGPTLTGGQDHATITVGGDTLTQGTGFTAETDDETTAENIKAAIHALSGVSATRSGAIVTIVNDAFGLVGNAVALESTGTEGGLTISGETLEGGAELGTVVIQGTTLTEQSDFDAITSNDATAADLATAIDGISGFSASAVGNVVTAYWATPGTDGNAKTMDSDFDGEGLTLSGATLEDGVAATYSDVFSYDDVEAMKELETQLDLDTLDGTGTVDVAIETNFNKDDADGWDQVETFTQLSSVGNETKEVSKSGMAARFKIVLGGTDTIATGSLRAVAR